MSWSSVFEAIEFRRSIRRFTNEPVDVEEIARICRAAYCAPAPHHSIPWRLAIVIDQGRKNQLARTMAARWREDMSKDGVPEERAQSMAKRSIEQLIGAPALILACVVTDELDTYPDERRQRAEFGMVLLSLGAAMQNIMLALAEAGYGSCWIAAPIFAPDEARDSLQLPEQWLPQALLMVGRPDPSYVPKPRPALDFEGLIWVM